MDDKQKRELQQQALQLELDQLLSRANANGFVITAETKPLKDLAMGHYLNTGEVRDWHIHSGRTAVGA